MDMIDGSRDSDIEILKKLEQSHSITIGLDRNYTNNLWWNLTIIGKILNSLTTVFIILDIIVFIKVGVSWGFALLLFIGVYAVMVQKIALFYIRLHVLFEEGNGYFFKDAYNDRKATIKDNLSGKIIKYPIDWREWVNKRVKHN